MNKLKNIIFFLILFITTNIFVETLRKNETLEKENHQLKTKIEFLQKQLSNRFELSCY
ncbi:hypothetical protein QG053_04725 [Kingella kingae]|uniref:hypothetical protein n=1 Tax=Kingella kingae TaxID=504 RepID=UPI00254E890E|nr:hypothetical protein [Kingella kingae]MDK4564357.1 hypothetical protein [Kingella kingae]